MLDDDGGGFGGDDDDDDDEDDDVDDQDMTTGHHGENFFHGYGTAVATEDHEDNRMDSDVAAQEHLNSEEQHDARYRCNICRVAFYSPKGFAFHMQQHLKGVVWCELCGKRLCSVPNFKKHMTLHTQNRPRFRCSICPLSFAWKKGLRRHLKQCHSFPVQMLLK